MHKGRPARVNMLHKWVLGPNGRGQNGTDKWYGQNGTDRIIN